MIQASMVDTWAATCSGAFALTENNLYTLEAFDTYLAHLKQDGLLAFSRWYFEFAPAETLRLTALAVESLERAGVEQPRYHVLLAKADFAMDSGPDGIATLIIKKTPFTPEEVHKAKEICEWLGFDILCSPDLAAHSSFDCLFDKSRRESFYRDYPLNIVPPNDDKPFFFHVARIRSFFRTQIEQGYTKYNTKAIVVLGNLLLVMIALAILFLLAPLFLLRSLKFRDLMLHWNCLLYFVMIGFGFIMVEIPLIQQFTLFLGHPIYSLSVILFSLLLFSSLGSLLTQRAQASGAYSLVTKALAALVLLLLVDMVFLSPIIHRLIAEATWLRIVVSVILIAPLGVLMGMPFPLGVKLTTSRAQFLIPWCWCLNGVFSVLASVTSIAVAISFGFTVALAFGTAGYLLALIMLFASRPR
ncbi:MAG: hypothetical protein HY801_02420 [Candidatus Lindowbacteria bacterium]|nr:hypothetical protein [Candidatus Lindowbacteria bacterium]